MRYLDGVEQTLIDEVNRARLVYEGRSKDFQVVVSDIPSGLPHPDGTARIRNAGICSRSAAADYAHALQEFNAFILDGVVPERLKASE